MATSNSAQKRGEFLLIGLAILAVSAAFGADSMLSQFAGRAQANYNRTRTQYEADTKNFTNAWQFARACFDYADFAIEDDQRAEIANQGIAACKAAISIQPKAVQGHYYLAMDDGQLARTELLGALKLVKQMEREFKLALGADSKFDYAGPERGLGLLYRDAPGWPTSIGSKRKARDYLETAARLAPQYPENLLNLTESYLKWGETQNAKTELAILDATWPEAQKQFSGTNWDRSWNDWTRRRNAARQKLSETSAPENRSGK